MDLMLPNFAPRMSGIGSNFMIVAQIHRVHVEAGMFFIVLQGTAQKSF